MYYKQMFKYLFVTVQLHYRLIILHLLHLSTEFSAMCIITHFNRISIYVYRFHSMKILGLVNLIQCRSTVFSYTVQIYITLTT